MRRNVTHILSAATLLVLGGGLGLLGAGHLMAGGASSYSYNGFGTLCAGGWVAYLGVVCLSRVSFRD